MACIVQQSCHSNQFLVMFIQFQLFSKLFKEATGENFIEYLTNIRIEKAKDLLLNSDIAMKELCSMCGYQDPNYFSRTFKKNVGLTPTEYKEKCLGK